MVRRWLAVVVVLVACAWSPPALAAAGGPGLPSPSYPTQLPPDTLAPGAVLHAGQALFSEPGQGIELAMQTDGNLVLSIVSARRVLWSAHTSGAGNYLHLQTDGNLVLRSSTNAPLWTSGTARTNAATFIITPEGNAVLATARFSVWTSPNPPPAPDGFVMSTLVSPHGQYRALMQTDGNLVVSSIATGAFWSSGTAGHPGSFLELQNGDGNLVIYGPKALWSSRTSGPSGADLVMQDDGNLVLYKGSTPVWSTHTAGHP